MDEEGEEAVFLNLEEPVFLPWISYPLFLADDISFVLFFAR